MKPQDEVRLTVLKSLSGKTNKDQKVLSDLLNSLYNKYSEKNWVNNILISMDIENEGLINIQFRQDAMGNLLTGIPSGAEHYLTPDGEYELENR
ncbi:hypothetical protein [Lentilactobacillus kisonensis]|uniref:Uncharacterized protein n=1 Tax=Lentilactobacillus kisonensis DSM 19906 = JCM 15041 TaxID=1423766 RepID=A0A0R1NVY2_9LACO|nr:hypothetical protein [Lentilactobacillus kisonensis]KRL21893.1 hypothetical protein FC98_GL000449 [Lentilactobacillus kisonensis DSM 19906 = JCM 15041]